jgi:hypothetical protein
MHPVLVVTKFELYIYSKVGYKSSNNKENMENKDKMQKIYYDWFKDSHLKDSQYFDLLVYDLKSYGITISDVFPFINQASS